jgi:hypothetical protein
MPNSAPVTHMAIMNMLGDASGRESKLAGIASEWTDVLDKTIKPHISQLVQPRRENIENYRLPSVRVRCCRELPQG